MSFLIKWHSFQLLGHDSWVGGTGKLQSWTQTTTDAAGYQYVESYNNKNQKVKEEFLDEIGSLIQQTTYEYNNAGQVTKAVTTNADGITTEYQYLDENGYTCTISFDATTGKPTSFTRTNSAGEQLYKEEYQYYATDPDRTTVKVYGNNDEVQREVSYNNGVICTEKVFNDDDSVTIRCFEYNEHGVPAITEYKNSIDSRNLIKKEKVEYYVDVLEMKQNQNYGPACDQYGNPVRLPRYKNEEEFNADPYNLKEKYPDMYNLYKTGEIPFLDDMTENIWEDFPETIYNSFYNFSTDNFEQNIPTNNKANELESVINSNVEQAEKVQKANKELSLDDYSILETITDYEEQIADIKDKMSKTTNEGEIAALQVELYFAYQNMTTNTNGLDLTSAINKFTQQNNVSKRKEKDETVRKELDKLNELLEAYPEVSMAEIRAQVQKVREAKINSM